MTWVLVNPTADQGWSAIQPAGTVTWSPANDWILVGGGWDDTKNWDDSSVWVDAPPVWNEVVR